MEPLDIIKLFSFNSRIAFIIFLFRYNIAGSEDKKISNYVHKKPLTDWRETVADTYLKGEYYDGPKGVR